MERILNLSGGKDSMYICYHMPNYYDRIVYFDTGIEYPFATDLIEWVKTNINKPLEVIAPRFNYNYFYLKYDTPTRRARWCNSQLKMDCVKQYRKKYPNCIDVIGIAYNETKRIKHDTNVSYPLHENCISEHMILHNLTNEPYYNLYNGYYDNLTRLGCMCCPMATRKELKYLYNNYPKYFYQIWQERNHWENKYNSNFYGNRDTNYIFNLVLYEIEHPEHNQRKKTDREKFEQWYIKRQLKGGEQNE